MFFWFRTKQITVDCFTASKTAYNLYPIKPAIKFIPDWWRSMPNKHITKEFNPALAGVEVPIPTLKNCPGVIDLYKKGFIVPLWADLVVKNTPDKVLVDFVDNSGLPTEHPRYQYDPAFQDYNHFKINSPWCVVERTGVEWIELPCTWNLLPLKATFHVLHGVLKFNIQHDTNINIFVAKANNDLVHLKGGVPVAHWVPLSDRNIKLKLHQLGEQEFYDRFKFSRSRTRTIGSYREMVAKFGSCPFRWR